jgi:hypothetical protein
MRTRALLLMCVQVLGCTSPTEEEPLDGDESDLASICAGSACATLTLPKAISSGLVVVRDQLFWVGEGPVTGTSSEPSMVLQHCTLPACSSVTTVTLPPNPELSMPVSIWDLRAAGDYVFFRAPATQANVQDFYLTDGVSLQKIYSDFRPDYQGYAVDANTLVTYQQGRASDSWARTYLRSCTLDAGTIKGCVNRLSKFRLGLTDLLLTPTKVIGVGSSSLYWYDRASLSVVDGPSVLTQGLDTFNAGESAITARVNVGGSPTRHTMEFDAYSAAGRSTNGWAVPGMAQASVENGTSLYVGTRGQGNVVDIEDIGVIAKLTPGKARKRTIAKNQNVGPGMALSRTRVYWLERLPGTSKQYVVRHAAN